MKKLVLCVLINALFICGVQAQQIVYDENAEQRQVENFTAIEVSGSMQVYLAQGSENALAVSAGHVKYNSKIKTEVKNGTLRISVDGGVWNGMGWTDRKLTAYVTVKELKKIDISGASVIAISETFSADVLKIDVSGASEIKGNLALSTLNIDISGASVVRFTGKVANALISASGASRFNSYNLVSEMCKADASGAASIQLTATSALSANASGGANIYYKGNPTTINVHSSAGASIKKRDGE